MSVDLGSHGSVSGKFHSLLSSLLFICLMFVLGFNNQVLADTHRKPLRLGVVHSHNQYLEASASYALSWEIVGQSAELADLDVHFVVNSWEGNIRQLKAGKIDGIFIGLRTPERESWASFSLPLVNTGAALFTRSSSVVEKMKQVDLSTEIVGVSAGSAQHQLAEKVGFESIYQSSKTSHLYNMLASGRVDYLFMNVDLAAAMCTGNAAEYCLKMVGGVHYRSSAHIISDSNYRAPGDALAELDTKLEAFSQSDEIISLFRKFGKSKARLKQWQSEIELAKRNRAMVSELSSVQLMDAP